LASRVDHSDIWWALQRIPLVYLDRAIEILFELIVELYPPNIFIVDATGIQTDRYRKCRRPRFGPKNKPPPKLRSGREKQQFEEREHVILKLHLLIGYCRDQGLLPILRARVTRGQAHDSPQLKHLLICSRNSKEGENLFPQTRVTTRPITTSS
jgi:hypothetical protein